VTETPHIGLGWWPCNLACLVVLCASHEPYIALDCTPALRLYKDDEVLLLGQACSHNTTTPALTWLLMLIGLLTEQGISRCVP
jgi:hypothetical protein